MSETERSAVAERDALARLEAAVADVQDGQTVAVGGYFQHRHPVAVVRELVRQGKRDLHLVAPLGGIDVEVALQGGIASRFTFAFVTLDIFGLAPRFRRAVESGELPVVEYGDVTLARSFEAAARRQPWYPARAWLGSDMADHHPGGPYRTEEGNAMWRAPALHLDWGIVHAPAATAGGDVALPGESFDGFILRAADRVIVTTDEVVSGRELIRRWNGRIIARPHCEHVVELPHGAHPTSCYPHYTQDVDYLIAYADAEAAGQPFDLCQADESTYRESIPAERLAETEQEMALALRVADQAGERAEAAGESVR